MVLRVVFFGNSQSQFSNRHFQALLEVPCNLAGVVDVPASERDSTNPASDGSPGFPLTAARRGVVFFEPANPNQPEFIAQMQEFEPDLFLSIGYPKIFRSDLLKVPRRLSVNFHASLLPAYRGKHPIFWCLRNGERWSGLSVHVMNSGVDTGDLLYQIRLRTRQDDTVASLYHRIIERSVNLVGLLMMDIEDNELIRTPQPVQGASNYSSITEQDFHLNWDLPSRTLQRWINITPGQCYAFVRGKLVYFMNAISVDQSQRSKPGEIVQVRSRSVLIATGDGLLRSGPIRLANGCQMSLAAYCRQVGLTTGDLLT